MTKPENNKNGALMRTVFALATPAVASDVSVIRLSGGLSPTIASILGVTGWVRCGVVGEVELAVGRVPLHLWCMPAPNSYTGQDTLEVFVPGHPEIIAALSEWLESKGCKSAQAGEFTRLAVASGKLDLSRAEAVMALVTANDDASRRRALADLSGQSAEVFKDLTRQLRQISARYEMLFDFSEEEHAEIEEAALCTDLDGFNSSLAAFVGIQASAADTSYSIALYGPPNAGKSSLFNALLGRPRSLVSDMPGTTRDAVRDEIVLGSMTAILIDLSGIGDSDTDKGAFSAQSTKQALEADVLLILSDPGSEAESIGLLKGLEKQDAVVRQRALWVNSKSDEIAATGDNSANLEQVSVSATSGAGLETLRKVIVQRLRDAATGGAISLQRQRAGEANRLLAEADIGNLPPEAIASEVRRALTLLDEALLSDEPGDVLNLIFSRFCIGK